MELAENVVIANRFRLIRMIGRGGMGSVWRAFDQNLNTDCAIKFIEGDITNLAEAHARFKREAHAAAQLRSPHIVQIFDHNIFEGVPYLAMELLDGEDLGHVLARNETLGPVEVTRIVQQVCRALGKAHEKGIVHRDLKPDNIFLVKDDDGPIAKVVDFGIAKLANPMELGGGATKTGSLLGTPYYMSPEQAQGTKSVDSRSDLWSLAVIVFQCFTGKLPFESEALGDLLVKIIVAPIPVPSSLNPNVPHGFDAWFAKAASREPENRYQTAKAFAESLVLALGLTAVAGSQHGVASMRASQISSPAIDDSGGFRTQLSGAPSGPQSMHSTPMSSDQSTLAGGHAVLAPAAPHAGPMGATFSGTLVPAGLPKKGSGMIIALAALGVIVIVGGGVGAVVALKHPANSIAVASSEIVGSTSVHVTSSATPSLSAVDPVATTPPADTLAGAGNGQGATAVTPVPSAATVANNAHGIPAGGAAAVPTHKANGAGAAPTNTGPHGKPPASAATAASPPTTNKPDLGF